MGLTLPESRNESRAGKRPESSVSNVDSTTREFQ
jgi:hypothetical protein